MLTGTISSERVLYAVKVCFGFSLLSLLGKTLYERLLRIGEEHKAYRKILNKAFTYVCRTSHGGVARSELLNVLAPHLGHSLSSKSLACSSTSLTRCASECQICFANLTVNSFISTLLSMGEHHRRSIRHLRYLRKFSFTNVRALPAYLLYLFGFMMI